MAEVFPMAAMPSSSDSATVLTAAEVEEADMRFIEG